MRRAILLLLVCVVIAIASPAQTFTTLYNFQGTTDGSHPYGTLVQGLDGNLYGETQFGPGAGGIFKITRQGELTTLRYFNGLDEPQRPYGGLTLGADGNFYGVSQWGGHYDQGTAFKITPDGTLTTLYSFCSQPTCSAGADPEAGLLLSADGNLYGSTTSGTTDCSVYFGYQGCGTVFKITPDGVLTVVHTFHGPDGGRIEGRLIQASDGNFYGTTAGGGIDNCSGGCGTVFRLTPGGSLTTLYSFCPAGDCPDGAMPVAGLIQGRNGDLYGTTYYGGGFLASGTIFEISLQGRLTTLYTFDMTHGRYPFGELLQAPDGNFYGMTYAGGIGSGTIYKMTPSGSLNVVHNFSSSDGDSVEGALILGSDGLMYAAAEYGGTHGAGIVFSLDPGFREVIVTRTGSGTIIGGEGHIYCGSTCSYVYTNGEQIELSPIPAPGFTFSGWTGCDNVQGSYCSVTVTSARNVTAAFTSSPVMLISLALKPSSVKGGQLSAATLTLSAAAPDGGLGVSIASNVPNAAHPPSWIVVPGGKTTAGFAVRTFPVKSKTLANISASTGGSQVGATLTVTTGYGSNPAGPKSGN